MANSRFLLLEENAIVVEEIRSLLAQGEIDCDLIQINHRTELLSELEKAEFDLVLAAQQSNLPISEVLEMLQKRGLDAPLIVLATTKSQAFDLLKRGATDYVLEQQLDDLVPVVYRALRESQKRHELQTALDQSQDRVKTIVANVPGMLYRYVSDEEGGAHFTFVSSGCRELFEVEPEVVLQDETAIWSLIHPDDVAGFEQSVNYAITHFLPWDWTGRMYTRSGRLRWIHGQSKAVQAEDGMSWDGHLIDISDRKTVEEALRQSELKFRMMVESAKDYAIFTLDLENAITSWNAGAQRLLQYTEAEILGQKGDIIFTPEDQANKKPEAEIQSTLNNGRAENERWHVCKDGSRLWGSGLMMPLANESDEIQGFLKIFQDKTEQRQTQEALRYQADQLAKANRIKDEFLAVLSHELRTPLNPILGWIKLLKSGRVEPARMQQAIDIIDRNAQLQTQLIEDLLDVSRILQGKLSLKANLIDLCPVVSAAIETVQLAASAKSIGIQFERPESVIQVMGDAGRLQQVIWNLLSNAVKFTPSGGRIQIQIEQLQTAVEIRVSDTGKGINPEFLPYVFEYFRQEDSSTTRQFGGLGLGLAIVRQIVDLHGGSVRVDSGGEGQGATFTVRLPLQIGDLQAGSFTSTIAQSLPQQSLNGIRVLVVDDEPDSRNIVSFVLMQAGAEVRTADSGMSALAMFSEFAPDLVVSDIGMPDFDGYMLIQQLRQSSQTPAIALTAYAGETDQQAALSAGFQSHLSKPIDPDRLISIVIELIQPS